MKERLPAPTPGVGTIPLWQFAVKLLVCGTVLVLIGLIIDWREFTRVALSASPEFLILAASLLIFGNIAIAWRWHLLMVPVGIVVSLTQALRSYLKGHFVAHFVPFGLTADVVKAVDLHGSRIRRGDLGRGIELTSSIFMERGFGAITVGIAVLAGLIVSPLVVASTDQREALLLVATIVVGCSVLALYTDWFLGLLPQALLRRAPKLAALVLRGRKSFVAYRREPGRLVAILLLSLVIQALRILPVYAIALAVGAGGDFYLYLIAVPVIFLASTVPLVGSRIGTEQGLFVLLLGVAGVTPESALVIALTTLVLGMIVSLPGGYWLLRDGMRSPQRA
jgi:uncharacterized membrane protein YbhN (UPF0104 family)